jgi:hypothetical protein
MKSYVVKVTDKDGWLMPPVVACARNEETAVEYVKVMFPDDCIVEAKGLRPDVMRIAFGGVPHGAAVMRHDWAWRGEGDDTPEPY